MHIVSTEYPDPLMKHDPDPLKIPEHDLHNCSRVSEGLVEYVVALALRKSALLLLCFNIGLPRRRPHVHRVIMCLPNPDDFKGDPATTGWMVTSPTLTESVSIFVTAAAVMYP